MHTVLPYSQSSKLCIVVLLSLFLIIRTLLGEQYPSVAVRTCSSCKTKLPKSFSGGIHLEILLTSWSELPCEMNRKIHKCLIVFKYLHNLVLQCLSNYFTRNSRFHIHNTRRKSDLYQPHCDMWLNIWLPWKREGSRTVVENNKMEKSQISVVVACTILEVGGRSPLSG